MSKSMRTTLTLAVATVALAASSSNVAPYLAMRARTCCRPTASPM